MAKVAEKSMSDDIERKLQSAHSQIETFKQPGITLSKENGDALGVIKASLPEKDWSHLHTDGAPKPYTFEQMPRT